MKLRILDDAVRLRLDRDEVDALGRGEPIGAMTRFPDDRRFRYEITTGETMAASFDNGVIRVTVPRDESMRWASDDTRVSIRGDVGPLSVLVEKDFECLEPREGESQSNRFPNPKASG